MKELTKDQVVEIFGSKALAAVLSRNPGYETCDDDSVTYSASVTSDDYEHLEARWTFDRDDFDAVIDLDDLDWTCPCFYTI